MRSYEKYVTADSDYYVYTPSALAQKLFFYPVCIGHFHYEPGYHLKRNNYDSFLLMLIIDGTCSILQKTASKQPLQAMLFCSTAMFPTSTSAKPAVNLSGSTSMDRCAEIIVNILFMHMAIFGHPEILLP